MSFRIGADIGGTFTDLILASDDGRLETPGGGGFGSAIDRNPALVLNDVRGGYVSAESARSNYGVAIGTEHWRIDEAETARLRSELRAPPTQRKK